MYKRYSNGSRLLNFINFTKNFFFKFPICFIVLTNLGETFEYKWHGDGVAGGAIAMLRR